MVLEDIRMSNKELMRVHLINNVIERKMTQVEAAGIMGISDRQVRAIVKRVREEGEKGLAHRIWRCFADWL